MTSAYRFRKSLLAAAVFAMGASAIHAQTASSQQVTLTSTDGQVVLVGEIKSFGPDFYEIQTAVGALRVSTSLMSCTGAACPVILPPVSEFAVSGASDLARTFMPTLLSAYASNIGGSFTMSEAQGGSLYTIQDNEAEDLAKVQVVSSTSTSGLTDLLLSNTAISLSTRPARPREAEAFAGSGLGDLRDASQENVVALDGLVIVTSKDNPIRSITLSDAALVFAGTYKNWADLGGPDAPIRLYVREADSGTGEVFSRLVMQQQALEITSDANILTSDADITAQVAQDSFGIGFTSFAARGDAKPLAILGVCGLLSAPSEFSIKTEEYPLTRRLYAYTTNDKSVPEVNKFLDFLTTNEAQQSIFEAGFVDQSIIRSEVEEQGLRFASAIVSNGANRNMAALQTMVSDMLASERLSTTFRFEVGSNDLDARAIDDVARLAEMLSQDTAFRKIVQLVGFTDAVGDPEQNAQLSQQRAEQVRDALLAERPDLADNIQFEAIGYGEISPLACNQTTEGRRINRRVEVWIKDDL